MTPERDVNRGKPDADRDAGPTASRRIGRNAAIRAAGDVLSKLGSLAFFVFMARKLGTSSFGDFTFALSLTTVLMTASGFGTDTLLAREVARDHSRVHHYLSNLAVMKAIAAVLLVLVAVGITTLSGQPPINSLVVGLVGLGVAIEAVGRMWHGVFKAYERLEFVSTTLVLQRGFTAAVGITVMALGGGLVLVSCVFLVASILGVASAHLATRLYVVRPRLELDRSRWLGYLKAGIPIGVATLLFGLILRIDATLLGLLRGGEDNTEVGLYGAAFRLVQATLFVSWSFGAATLPWLARHGPTTAIPIQRAYELGLKLMAALLFPIGIAYVLLAEPIIELLYGEGYSGAVLPLQLLGVVTVFYGLNYFTGTVLTARDRPGVFSKVLVVVAVQNIVLNLILIPPYGADGAAFTAATSGLLLVVLGTWKARSVLGSVRLRRVLAAPIAGGAAMCATILPTDLPLLIALVAGGAAYTAMLVAAERVLNPKDFSQLLSVARRSRGDRSPARDREPEDGVPLG